MARKSRQIEVKERPVEPDLSSLPDELVDHYSAQGMRLTLASRHDNNVSRLSVRGRHPVALQDLPESLAADKALALRKLGIYVTPDGILYKGDCFIFAQPLDAYEAQMKEGLLAWSQQDSPNTVEDTAEELTGMLRSRKLGHVGVMDGGGGSLSDHVGRIGS